jgi:hypothetical protein
MNIRWWSQPFAPEGSAAAEGIVKQLGQPALDPLTVLVREAAQNSWDAHRPDGVVGFTVDVRVLGHWASAWRELLLPGPRSESGVKMEHALDSESILIVVSDRNTVGLGGPLRASERALGEDKADFVQFLRNVGEPSDHAYGGGTYGFGKGILYRLSRVGTILVDTNTAADGPNRRRLMGASLGHSWLLGDRRFTGRHWWGRVGDDDVPDPVLGDQAAELSKRLGLPGFDDGGTGTDIVILAAGLGTVGTDADARERTPHEAATFMASSILWNLWPKMIPDGSGRHMRFAVGVDRSEILIPAPESIDELEPYVESLCEVRAGRGISYTRTVPPRNAGSLAVTFGAALEDTSRLVVTAAKPYDGSSHHTARMRLAELVVDYLPGPPHPDARFSYGGVFRTSEDSDSLFSSAEPPTHDDWVPKGLSGTARGVVIGAKTFIAKQLDERLGLGAQSGGTAGQGLGQLSALLAGVIPARFGKQPAEGHEIHHKSSGSAPSGADGGAEGRGGPPDVSEGAIGTAQPRRGGMPRLVGPPMLRLHDGRPLLVATVKIPAAAVPRTVSVDVEVVVDRGGIESEPPLGAARPAVLEWRSRSGDVVVRGQKILAPAGEESDWFVYATHVPDAVVRFRLNQAVADAG